jgi:hypothetical protein
MPIQPSSGYSILQSALVMRCVYWSPQIDSNGSQLVDSNGKALFNTPIQIHCRWSDKVEVFLDKNGNQQISKAWVRVPFEVLELGVLWFGFLRNINVSGDPFDNTDAWEIRLYKEIPNRWGYDSLKMAIL